MTTRCGVPTRLFRMSFTGDRGFEVNVPADYGQAVWEALWAEGQKHGACAYGTEAMHVMRAEQGFIIVGQETDGTVTPQDLGLGGMVKKSGDFIGRRSLFLQDAYVYGFALSEATLPFDGPDTVRRARQCLDESGFTLDALTERLGIHAFAHLALGELAPLLRATRAGDRLDTLIRLFICGTSEPDDAIEAMITIIRRGFLALAD